MYNDQERQKSTSDGNLPLHVSSHRSHVSDANHETSRLTVENVTKLEDEYKSADRNLPERRTLEEYIRKQLPWSNSQQNSKTPLEITKGPEGRPVDSEVKSDILYRRTEKVPSGNGNEADAQADTSTESSRGPSSSVDKRGYVLDQDHFNTKNAQTQTERSWHDMSSSSFIANEHPESEDTMVRTSVATGAEISVAKQERVVDKTPHTKYEEELCNSERSCIIEDKLPTTTEGQTMCAFCHEAKKPFPTPEQLSSEPEHTLFCCESYQTLFHYFIMGIIEANTCGEKEDPFDIRPDADFGGGQDVVENLKKDEDTIDIKPHFYFAEEQEAFEDLKKEFSKTNMQNYIISVANHLKVFGSLFAMNTISFTLAAEDNKITDNVKIDIPYSGNAFNCFLDDLFISVPVLPNPLLEKDSVGLFDHSKSIPTPPRDSLLHPLMVKGLHSSFPVEQKLEDPPRGQHTTIQKTEKKASIEHYHTGKNFSILFPDGTGQFFYPSGNIGILIICSDPLHFTLIILEDVEQKPQVQAVFMSNGHSVCFHPNGMLWTVLDPLGGSYLEENGMHKKIWTWWDFSQHVHAPPFQSITLRLNPNTEVSLLAQDQIHVTFSSNKKKATFNVGSKLLLKDPGKAILLKKALGSKEASYLRLKKYQIYSLLDHISKSVRISTDLPNRTEIIQDCVSQIIKSITYIRKLASRHQDPLLFQMKFSKGIVGESAGVRDPHIKKKQRERISQQTGGHPAKAASSTQAKSRKDTKEMAKKHGGKQPANKNMQQRTEILKPL